MKDNIVLVTGAATGIGRETAIAFARKGAEVVVSDINKEELAHTVKLVEEEGGGVLSIDADVSDAGDVQNMISRIVDTFGRIDVAVNNAGIAGESAETAEYSIEAWDKVIGINLRGQFICMKYELEAMLKKNRGSVVNIGSILGNVGYAGAPAYVAAKHGLAGLTRTAAIEYSKKGIRVNAVSPGFIETPMLEKAGIMSDKEIRDYIISLHPIGRLGKPEEVADAIVWLSSDEASFVTGHILLVDGGYTAR